MLQIAALAETIGTRHGEDLPCFLMPNYKYPDMCAMLYEWEKLEQQLAHTV